jgi:hypothetical protein
LRPVLERQHSVTVKASHDGQAGDVWLWGG